MTTRKVALGAVGAAVVVVAFGVATLLHGHQGATDRSNDRAAYASPLRTTLLAGSIASATPDPQAVASGWARPTERARWFRWSAPRSGRTVIAPTAATRAVPDVRVFLRRADGSLTAVAATAPSGSPIATTPPPTSATAPSEAATSVVADPVATDTTVGTVAFTAVARATYVIEVGAVAPEVHAFRFVILPPVPAIAAARPTPYVDSPAPVVTCAPAPTAWASGTVTLSCTATSAVGLVDPADASFTLSASIPEGAESADVATGSRSICDTADTCVTAGPIDHIAIDRAPPHVVCDPVPAGWSPNEVSITCRAADGGSGLAAGSSAVSTETTQVGAGASGSPTLPAVTVCDAVGNCAHTDPFGPIEIDRAPPVATCATPPVGWASDEVTVTCSVVDDGSGLADPSRASVHLTTAVGAGEANAAASTNTVQACDNAGNCVTVGPVHPIRVDRAPPVVTCLPPTGWAGGSVAVTCQATDVGAGLVGPATVSVTAQVASGEESDHVASTTVQVCDAAKNCVTAGPVDRVAIDRRPPQITCDPPPVGWADGDVVIACAATDGGSGLASKADATFTLTAKGLAGGVVRAATTSSHKVCDVVGNCATAGPIAGIAIDEAPPTFTCTQPPGATFALNVTVTCTAADGGSGLAPTTPATFTLVTAVPSGTHAARAVTGRQAVCDTAGSCVTAGPYTFDIDRTGPPPGHGPEIAVPERATVVLASKRPVAGPAAAYTTPHATDTLGEALPSLCSPGPSSALVPGWTTVSCRAVDGADRETVDGFPLVVKVDPSLASTAPAPAGGSWRVVGLGFAPGSSVVATFDSTRIGSTISSGSGTAAVTFAIPADAGNGAHEVTLVGVDAQHNPLAVVEAIATVVRGKVGLGGSASPSKTTGGVVATGAPAPVADGATLPADPGPAPSIPQPSHFVVRAAGVPVTSHGAKGSGGGLPGWVWGPIGVGGALVLAGVGGGIVRLRRRRGAIAKESAE